jgi:hypothetical protein
MYANDMSRQHSLSRNDNTIDEWQPGKLSHSSEYCGLKRCRNMLGNVAKRAPIERTIPVLPIMGWQK